MEAGLAPTLHMNQNRDDNTSVKTGSPAYSDISDAGEDGKGKAEGVKVKPEPDQGPREGAKKALFPPQASNKDSPYYLSYDAYYSPTYANPSPGPAPAAPPHEPATALEQAKSVIMAKGEDSKAPPSQPEGLKIKLSEGGHHGKEEPKSGVESGRAASVEAAMWYSQEPDSRLWSYVYPSKYSEAPKPQEDDRWKEEWERKVTEERSRPKESVQKDEAVKEATEGRTQLPPKKLRGGGKETRPPHMQFPSPLAQHQVYVPCMHGPYAYSQGYEPSHPGYRGSYLPASYYASSYGGKVGAGEDSEKPSRLSPSVKPSSEAKALDLLQLHASQYKSKSPSIQDSKTPHDREREKERKGDRPRSSPSQRIMQSHHHLRYPLCCKGSPFSTFTSPDAPCFLSSPLIGCGACS
ncbi:unnamed protein product [Oreochromis niloticus]|nr:unnamed protein product [Mustela putorius furo]